MPFDARLADRIRQALGPRPELVEQHMFGGLAFMLDGKMLCAIIGDELVVRVGPAAYAAALARPHTRPMDFTGKPLTGFVFVAPAATRTVKAVAAWLARAEAYVATIPRAHRRRRRRIAASVRR